MTSTPRQRRRQGTLRIVRMRSSSEHRNNDDQRSGNKGGGGGEEEGEDTAAKKKQTKEEGGGGGGGGGKENKRPTVVTVGTGQAMPGGIMSAQTRSVFELLTVACGVTGTLSIVLGAVFHINPLAYFRIHSDVMSMTNTSLGSVPFGSDATPVRDAIIGLYFGLPIYACDALLMLPNYVFDTATKTPAAAGIDTKGSSEAAADEDDDTDKVNGRQANGHTASVATTSSGTDGNIDTEVYLDKLSEMYSDTGALLADMQCSKIKSNPARGLSVASELLVIVCAHLADEMFHRGLVLVGLRGALVHSLGDALWDRGIDDADVSQLFTALRVLPPQLRTLDASAGFIALLLVCAFSVAFTGVKVFNKWRVEESMATRQGENLDMLSIRNICAYNLCPLIWSMLTPSERDTMRILVAEEPKNKTEVGEGEQIVASADAADAASPTTSATKNGTSAATNGSGADTKESEDKKKDGTLGELLQEALQDGAQSSTLLNSLASLSRDRPSPRAFKKLLRMCESAVKERGASKSAVSRILKSGRETTFRLSRTRLQIEGVRDILEVLCFSSAFLATQNLLASYASSVVADILFSSYQRAGIKRATAYDRWREKWSAAGTTVMANELLASVRLQLEATKSETKKNKEHEGEQVAASSSSSSSMSS